jgi:hypothetical protein
MEGKREINRLMPARLRRNLSEISDIILSQSEVDEVGWRSLLDQ